MHKNLEENMEDENMGETVTTVFGTWIEKVDDGFVLVDGKTGKRASKPYAEMEYGLRVVCVRTEDGKAGVINLEGKEIVPCIYSEVDARTNSIIIKVYDDSGNVGAYDRKGNQILPCDFARINAYENLIVSDQKIDNADYKHGNTKVYDLTGKQVYDVGNDRVEILGRDVIAVSKRISKAYKWGIIDLTHDATAEDYEFDNVGRCFEGAIPVKIDGKWGLIKSNGEEITPCIYEPSRPGNDFILFKDGIAETKKNDNEVYIDKDGNEYNKNEAEIMRSEYRQETKAKAEFVARAEQAKTDDEAAKIYEEAKIEIEAIRDHAKAEVKKERSLLSLELVKTNTIELINKL